MAAQAQRSVEGLERQASPRKKLIRRAGRDYSQQLRLSVQLAFLGLNVWVGVLFFQWVRWAENGQPARTVERPAGVEGWLPIAGLMQLKYVAATHRWPAIHPAGLFLLTAFLLMSFLLRESFCSWLCPIGTLSEYLWKLGRYTFRGLVGYAKLSGHWNTSLPQQIYFQLVPQASQTQHP
jgi:polyferredoxin